MIIESYDLKTALEVILQFFPGIKPKRETRNCASKACLSNEKTSSSVFCRLRISDWLFHRPALSIGQKTKLSLLRSSLSSFRFIFTSAVCLWSHFSCEIASLDRTGIELLGPAAVEGVCGWERLKL